MRKFILLLSAAVNCLSCIAQDGSIDPGFGNNGKCISYQPNGSIIKSIVTQNDGKIVAAGYTTYSHFLVARFNSNGSSDTAFGNNGIVTTYFPGGYAQANSVLLQGDNKIILAGKASNGNNDDFVLVRYLPDGSVDSSFGQNGSVFTDFNGEPDRVLAVKLQNDGKIVVSGACGLFNGRCFGLARYNTDGSPDSTFDSDGRLTTAVNIYSSEATSLAIWNDGKIIAGGYSRSDPMPYYNFSAVRYNGDGSLDAAFGSGGITFGPSGYTEAMVLQSDGKIVQSGWTENNDGEPEITVSRYNDNGGIDSTFNSTGYFTFRIGPEYDMNTSLAIDQNGKIILGGFTILADDPDFTLIRLNTDGTFDPSFGTGGKVITPLDSIDQCYAITVQNDGKILAGGMTHSASNSGFALVRYNNAFTGIENAVLNNKVISLYPNPSQNFSSLSYTASGNHDLLLRVFNSQGQLIYTENVSGFQGEYKTELHLGGYSKGIYNIVIIHGKEKVLKRLVLN
ncbi:MAG TPA: T9SS type A sorting domain-containing protein [Bacteroidia bacterium]|jgi:uncharacterized delta-60 repeat protein